MRPPVSLESRSRIFLPSGRDSSERPRPPPPPPGPPPPGQPPQPPSSGGQMPTAGGGNLDAGTAIGYGWRAMTRYIGPFILIALVVVLVQVALSVAGYYIDNYWLRMT